MGNTHVIIDWIMRGGQRKYEESGNRHMRGSRGCGLYPDGVQYAGSGRGG